MIESCCSALVMNSASVMYFAPTCTKFMTRYALSGISQASKISLDTGPHLPLCHVFSTEAPGHCSYGFTQFNSGFFEGLRPKDSTKPICINSRRTP